MKAAVFHGVGDIRVEDIPKPTVKPNEVLVKVKACGVCGSDLHPYKMGGPKGMIFGHEFSGDVVEIGSNVTDVKEGERVVALSGIACQNCHWCKQGEFFRCPDLIFPGYGDPGAMAEYVLIHEVKRGFNLVTLPDNLSYEVGATVEPLSVALYSVTRSGIKPEDTAVVIGAGVIGLCIVQVLKAMGVSQIIISGRRAKRLELAKLSGADVVVDAAQEDIVSVVKSLRAERLADVVFECAGSPDTFKQSIKMVHHGGKVVLVGIYEQPITWNPTMVVTRDISLIGIIGEDFPGSIELLETGKADTRPMISHEFSLDDVKKAFDTQLKEPDAVKVLVKP